MAAPEDYLVIARDARSELEVKRSVFVCDLARVASEDEARSVIAQARARNPRARHHCTAFVIGPDAALRRSNDDGEPSGTAGAPMLEVLSTAGAGAGVSDVVAVVTRWFGGVLLGAGGLARAYAESVQLALAEAGLRQRQRLQTFSVALDHGQAGRVEGELRARQLSILSTSYGELVTLTVAARPDQAREFPTVLAELTSGQSEAVAGPSMWVDGPRLPASR